MGLREEGRARRRARARARRGRGPSRRGAGRRRQVGRRWAARGGEEEVEEEADVWAPHVGEWKGEKQQGYFGGLFGTDVLGGTTDPVGDVYILFC